MSMVPNTTMSMVPNTTMTTDLLAPSLLSTLALVGALGFRHGFDADHIAAVDGMTRSRQVQHSYWMARGVGLQFALGHSAVILLASLLLYGQSARLPAWLDGLGLAVSSLFLLIIASANLRHALQPKDASNTDACATPSGPLTALLLRATGGNLHPALVGMAFALSFDALAQAAYFASRGSAFSGMAAVALLAAAFGAGMVLADATNGALLCWFAQRGDRLKQQASRFTSGFIAILALATVASSLWRERDARFAQAWDDAGPWVGLTMMAASLLVLAGAAWRRQSLQHSA